MPHSENLKTVNYERARDIMGRNFIGTERAYEFFGISFSPSQNIYFRNVPFPSEDELEAYKNTHILVAVPQFSILAMRQFEERTRAQLFFDDGEEDCHVLFNWPEWDKEPFVNSRYIVQWHLVRKTPVSGSINLAWDDQQKLLDENEKTPPARVIAYTCCAHRLATGEILYKDALVRCSDYTSHKLRVVVGGSPKGLYISGYDDGPGSCIGLSSSFVL